MALVLAFLNFNQASAKTDVYYYLDTNGNPVFSDEKPVQKHQIKQLQPINQVEWVKSNPKISYPSGRNKKGTSHNTMPNEKASKCKQLEKKISTLERKLKDTLRPDSFDAFQRQLSDARWEKHKSC